MRSVLGVLAIVGACAGIGYAQAAKPAAGDATAAVKQTEMDWIAGMKAGDANRVAAVLDDGWMGFGPDGGRETKAQYLAHIKNGELKLMSVEVGPMDVWVNGSVAVVQGSDTEKSSFKAKDSSGKYVWTDVFELKAGKWQAVRSQSAMVPK